MKHMVHFWYNWEYTWDYIKSVPKDALSNLHNLHKDTQEGAFEVALKGPIEVALELNLYCICWCTHRCAKAHKIIHIIMDLMLH